MKLVKVVFEDEEHTALLKAKGKKPWKQFILEGIEDNKHHASIRAEKL